MDSGYLRFCRPVRGYLRSPHGPTAYAVGYGLPALRAFQFGLMTRDALRDPANV
jgi:hypothetical protein